MFKLMFKTVVSDYGFNFKLKNIVKNYSYNFKIFITVVTNYDFDKDKLV